MVEPTQTSSLTLSEWSLHNLQMAKDTVLSFLRELGLARVIIVYQR
jgi:hypothetical protein